MRCFASLILLLAVPFAVCSATFTVPLTRWNSGTSPAFKRIFNAYPARAALQKRSRLTGPATIPATFLEYTLYTVNIGVGRPPTYYTLILDTGSANFVCGTNKTYVRTPTSIPTGEGVNVTYGSGNFTGWEYLDQVTLAPGLVITNQSIADAIDSVGFGSLDGILGLAPCSATKGSLSSNRSATIPTVMDTLMSQRLIEKKVFSIYLAPATNANDTNGVLTFGGTDSTLYEGELTYAPVSKTPPASGFWGINVSSVTYGKRNIISTSLAGFVDTGSSGVFLADDFFNTYVNAIPGAKLDSDAGLIEIPPESIPSMQPFNILIGDRVFTLDVAAQLLPKQENVAWGGDPKKQYGQISNLGFFGPGANDMNFILGTGFLERYYTVFDGDKNRIGFAQTKNTFTTYEE